MDRKMLSQEQRPNIVNVKIDDSEDNITIVSMTSRGNIVLLGTSNG